MPSDEALQYNVLKKALLKRYEMTEEGFRNKFRHTKPEQGETAHQFVARLQSYFNRWVDMSGCVKEYKDLADLLIQEQFVNTCSAEMALFLRERVPKNISEMVKLAEQYLEAHGMSLQERQKPMKKPNGHHQKSKDPSKTEQKETDKNEGRCYVCHKQGHLAKDCRQAKNQQQRKPTQKAASATTVEEPKEVTTIVLCEEVDMGKLQSSVEDGKLRLADGAEIPVLLGACKSGAQMPKRNNLPVSEGYVGDKKGTVLRDTGCTSAVVRRSLVTMDQMTDKKWSCALIDRTIRRLPVAKLQVDTPYYKGELYAMCVEDPIYDLIIGNIQGVQTPSRIDKKEVEMVEKAVGPDDQGGAMPKGHTRELDISEVDPVEAAAVTTRAQAEKDKHNIKPLIVSSSIPQIGAQELKEAQKKDTTLRNQWEKAKQDAEFKTKGEGTYKFKVIDEVLYRIFQNKLHGEVKQIVVPEIYWKQVMKLAHESIVGGHLGAKKTVDRITSNFHWPGVVADVARFCRSCDICQKTAPKGHTCKVPLGEMPLMEEPFKRVAVDLVGPISPVSEKGNRYILTVVDFATRYPEAVALPKIETERVAEALLEVFSRVGFPRKCSVTEEPNLLQT